MDLFQNQSKRLMDVTINFLGTLVEYKNDK